MFPEFGQFSLILAWLFSFLLAVLPLAGVKLKNESLLRTAPALAWAMFCFLVVAFGILMTSFMQDDFSVYIVSQHSNSALPWYFKMSATWANHEGSMLLWILMLGGWTVAVTVFARTLNFELKGAVLGVLGLIAFSFLMFILFTSNPFERVLPIAPPDGSDLNPLLQDIGLIIHPPTLYMGYVGFSVAFAFAVAALITGRFDASWVRWSRPWTNVAWAFLTLGIALGSWWAYYELGWGGWWFWDPVENASFMPWLIGTALIHSQAVTDKRNLFKSWSVLLAIFAFSFSLLGTFLVRSGVLTSVHSFAADPDRGLFILVILALTIGGSLTLYALNAGKIKTSGRFELVSRESFILMNNILLVVIAFAVLFGTLLPLFADAFGWRKLSVGAPFFNLVFNLFMVVLLGFLGVGQLMRWKKDQLKSWRSFFVAIASGAVVVALILPWTLSGELHWQVWLGLSLVFWTASSLLRLVRDKTRHSKSFLAGVRKAGVGFWGMWIAHLGLLVSTTGVVLVSNLDIERDFRMTAGDEVTLENYRFEFESIGRVQGPNYTADRGIINVYRDDKAVAVLNPEKRFYPVKGNLMTEAGIDGNLVRDLFVSLAEPLDDERQVWSIRLQVKPFIRWLWFGAVLMAIGGTLSITDKRYRSTKKGVTV
ncbi:heme lyase CcmF/NrfE family subunit [Reinekea sp.]|jgi:cytochrome c-type biogenesis protein CcmF|uniref:heme lyase CcmF/NrfE family subunit n=1 Tax=Reinekea sp. TaxID=1970455 RepID=UPI002A820D3F|nr:heme lyase CcmF/NrfE family subunit [Reinekea sp.]